MGLDRICLRLQQLFRISSPSHCSCATILRGLGRKDSIFGPDEDTSTALNPIRWVGNDRVAFVWSDASGNRQVMTVDLSPNASYLIGLPERWYNPFVVGANLSNEWRKGILVCTWRLIRTEPANLRIEDDSDECP